MGSVVGFPKPPPPISPSDMPYSELFSLVREDRVFPNQREFFGCRKRRDAQLTNFNIVKTKFPHMIGHYLAECQLQFGREAHWFLGIEPLNYLHETNDKKAANEIMTSKRSHALARNIKRDTVLWLRDNLVSANLLLDVFVRTFCYKYPEIAMRDLFQGTMVSKKQAWFMFDCKYKEGASHIQFCRFLRGLGLPLETELELIEQGISHLTVKTLTVRRRLAQEVIQRAAFSGNFASLADLIVQFMNIS